MSYPGRNYIRPPPLPPFLAKRHFPGEGGGGVYFEAPRGRNFIPPPFYTPPTPRRVFSGVGGGWGCIKFGPVSYLILQVCISFLRFFRQQCCDQSGHIQNGKLARHKNQRGNGQDNGNGPRSKIILNGRKMAFEMEKGPRR